MIDVVLHSGRDRSLRRRHPWLLAGAVARVLGDPAPGCWARVLSAEGETLGFGHYSPASALRTRMLCFGKEEPGEGFLAERIAAAVARREDDPLLAGCDAVRLVNAEGDGLPGLVADRYGDLLVVKLTGAGMLARREEVALALQRSSGAAAGFERAEATAARREGFGARDGPLWGSAPPEPVAVCERGRRFDVRYASGQKTGFYLDQRDARDCVQALGSGRRVLDLFAYTGGFSVAAARGGAASATLVESSAEALALAATQLARNAPDFDAERVRGNAFEYLRREGALYDLIVVDPPPLARARRDVPRAARAYKDLLLHALRAAAPGAFLLGFACSHHVGDELFRKIAFGAALDAGREVQVLRVLSAPSDHPVSIHHPEGAYLTGLLLRAG